MDRIDEAKVRPTNSVLNNLIAEHAQKARRVYATRTAGDFTFTGLLGEFTLALKSNGLLNEEQ